MRQSYVPRTFIYIAQVFGIVMGVCMFIAGVVAFNPGRWNTTMNPITSTVVLTIISYFAWKSIFVGIWIIRFVKNNSDEVIANNKFIISALSLSLNGIFTPFIMTMMPNVNTTSTISPRYTISNIMGQVGFFGAMIGLAMLFIGGTVMGKIPMKELISSTGPLVLMILLIGLLALSAPTFFLFSSKNAEQELADANTSKASIMKAISTVWLAIITLELIGVIFMAIIRLIAAILDMMRAFSEADGFFGFILIMNALFRLVWTFMYVMLVIRLTMATIKGIWNKEGVVHMHSYEALATKQAEAERTQKA
ncbi:hypothetical protein [Williamsoniiplasma lucivorax]|uniref:Uncharacterized protein n=1 Tax=Williamsoniiplasma lucivorax TaxID=209274 RepID=A0A2S5RCR9_9MOLU|nr:hypothetical protein [Williamsoniiplasma lucivorax]PPE05126.1 hypothetical protein ELUCI_v1c06620 [Williamsoniiplasma lucivorax]